MYKIHAYNKCDHIYPQTHTCCHAEPTENGKTDFFPLLLNVSTFIVYFPSRMCNFNILLLLETKDEIFPMYDFRLGVLSHLMLGQDWTEYDQDMTVHCPNSEMRSYKMVSSCS